MPGSAVTFRGSGPPACKRVADLLQLVGSERTRSVRVSRELRDVSAKTLDVLLYSQVRIARFNVSK